MRGTSLKPPREHDTRVRSWYAIWTVTIGLEWRQWEKVTVRQILKKVRKPTRIGFGVYVLEWTNVEFLDGHQGIITNQKVDKYGK